MNQFPQMYSLLISLVMALALSSAVCKANCLTVSLRNDSIHPLSVCMETEKGGFCGLLLMEKQESIIKGCLFNEFGITAFNFEYNVENGKTKVYDTILFFNKWYIKKTLKDDLRFLFDTILHKKKLKSKGRELEITNDSVVLKNLKYHIVYSFSNNNSNDTIE